MRNSNSNEQNINKVNGSQIIKINDFEEIISAIDNGLDIENTVMEIKTFDNKSMIFQISFDNDSPYYRVIGKVEGEEEDRVSSICGGYDGADIEEFIEAVKEIMKAPKSYIEAIEREETEVFSPENIAEYIYKGGVSVSTDSKYRVGFYGDLVCIERNDGVDMETKTMESLKSIEGIYKWVNAMGRKYGFAHTTNNNDNNNKNKNYKDMVQENNNVNTVNSTVKENSVNNNEVKNDTPKLNLSNAEVWIAKIEEDIKESRKKEYAVRLYPLNLNIMVCNIDNTITTVLRDCTAKENLLEIKGTENRIANVKESAKKIFSEIVKFAENVIANTDNEIARINAMEEPITSDYMSFLKDSKYYKSYYSNNYILENAESLYNFMGDKEKVQEIKKAIEKDSLIGLSKEIDIQFDGVINYGEKIDKKTFDTLFRVRETKLNKNGKTICLIERYLMNRLTFSLEENSMKRGADVFYNVEKRFEDEEEALKWLNENLDNVIDRYEDILDNADKMYKDLEDLKNDNFGNEEIEDTPIEEERDTRNVIDRIREDFAISEEDKNYLNEYEENIGDIANAVKAFESYSKSFDNPMVKGTDYDIETELQINANFNKERNLEIRISSKEYDKEVTETVYDDDVYNELFIKYLILGMITKLYEKLRNTPFIKSIDINDIDEDTIKEAIIEGVEDTYQLLCGDYVIEFRDDGVKISGDGCIQATCSFDMSEMSDEKGVKVIKDWIKENIDNLLEDKKEEILKEIREEAKMCAHFEEEEFEANYWKIKNDLTEGKEPYFQTPYGAVDYFKDFLDGGNIWEEWEKKYGMDKDDIYELIGDTDFWKGYEVFKEIVYSEERKVWNEVYEEVEKDIMLEKTEKYKDKAEELYYSYENETYDSSVVDFNVESDDYDFDYCSNYSFGCLSVEEDDDEDYEIRFSSNESKISECVYIENKDWNVDNLQIALSELNQKIVDTLLGEEMDNEAILKRMAKMIRKTYEEEKDIYYTPSIDLEDDGRCEEDWKRLVIDNMDELEEMTGLHLYTERAIIGLHLNLYIKEREEE